jgi:hypothetical protein
MILTVPGCQTVLEAIGDVVALYGRTNVKVLALIQATLQVSSYVLCELSKQDTKQSSQQWPGQIQSLLAKVIAIVLFSAAQPTHEKLVNSISQEEPLFRFAMLFGSYMRQDFLLQNT